MTNGSNKGKGAHVVQVVWKKHERDTSNEKVPEFIVMCNPGMVEKYRKDKSIALVEVVQSFDVMVSATGGTHGILTRPSHQQLEQYFSTHNEQDVVQYIINNGTVMGETSHLGSGLGGAPTRS